MACHWCGDEHGVDQLCQRAQRGMTRRSFCFLFGAGIVGYALPPQEDSFEIIAEIQPFDFNRILLDEFVTPQYLQPFKITGLRDLGPFKITGTFIRATELK